MRECMHVPILATKLANTFDDGLVRYSKIAACHLALYIHNTCVGLCVHVCVCGWLAI